MLGAYKYCLAPVAGSQKGKKDLRVVFLDLANALGSVPHEM